MKILERSTGTASAKDGKRNLPKYIFSNYLFPTTEVETAAEDRKRFWNMLAVTIPKTGFTAPDRTMTILDLACGKCVEGGVLESYFGGRSLGDYNEADVKIVGVDIDAEKIDQAKNAYRIRKNFAFYTVDAANLSENLDIPTKADVVVIRNQQINGSESHFDPELWPQIFAQALEHVTDDGIVIITSCLDTEHHKAIEALRRQQCKIIIDQQNQFAMKFTESLSRDKWVTIVQKS